MFDHSKVCRFHSSLAGILSLISFPSGTGLKRLETGAFVKDYEGSDKEMEQAVQMTLSEVLSEDPRFMEREAPPLSEEFPEGSKIFFLGEHAYGVAAQVSSTTETSLSVILAVRTYSFVSNPFQLTFFIYRRQFFTSDKAENDKFKAAVDSRKSGRYYPSFKVADMVGISGRALSKITSSFMVITSDNQKTNLGLSLKFEAKGLKVINYSRKDGRHWEFSDKAVELIRDYKASDHFGELSHSHSHSLTISGQVPRNLPFP
jgi:5''-3'' exonuclease